MRAIQPSRTDTCLLNILGAPGARTSVLAFGLRWTSQWEAGDREPEPQWTVPGQLSPEGSSPRTLCSESSSSRDGGKGRREATAGSSIRVLHDRLFSGLENF